MFISRKRWNQMEQRISNLEKQSSKSPLSEMKSALKSALENVAYQMDFCPEDSGGIRDVDQSNSTAHLTGIRR